MRLFYYHLLHSMRTILFLFAFIFAALAFNDAQAQSNNDLRHFRVYKNHIGIGYLHTREVDIDGFGVPSINYKRYFYHGAFTFKFGGTINNTQDVNIQSGKNYRALAMIRSGYEYHVNLGRLVATLGAEAFGGYSNRDQDNFNETIISESFVVGVSPLVGFKFWIAERLSFDINTRFDLNFKKTSREYSFFDWQSQAVNTTFTESQGMNLRITPIGEFMFNFHF